MLKRIFSLALLIGALLVPWRTAFGCDDYGCDSWSGLYATGDYNLYNFGLDISSLGGYDYGSSYDSYGGSCGSLISTCSGGYDQGLYGSDWGLGTSSGFSLDLDLNLLGYLDTSSSNSCSVCTMSNPYDMGYDVGCGVGYCGSDGYMPYYSEYPSNTPWYNGGIDLYNPTYPSPYTPVGYNPFYPPTDYPMTPPPTTTPPPWMGCDNIVIPCPTGPVGRYEPGLEGYPRRRFDVPRDPGLPRPNIPVAPYFPPGGGTHDPIFDPNLPPGGVGPFDPNFPIGLPPNGGIYTNIPTIPGTRNRVPRDPSAPIPVFPNTPGGSFPPGGNFPPGGTFPFPNPGNPPPGTSYIDVSGVPGNRNRVPRDPNSPAPVFPTNGGTTTIPGGSTPPSGVPTSPPTGGQTTDFVPVGRNPVRVPRSGF